MSPRPTPSLPCLFFLVLLSILGVSWRADVFNPCSVACGGGTQNRSVVCLRHDVWGTSGKSVVSDILCPPPKPASIRSCNMHACMAHWRKDTWSECSVTCGIGVQVRIIQCQRQMLEGQLFAVSQSECGGLHIPDTSRRCYKADCLNTDSNEATQLPGILSENYTLIQLRRAKKLKLIIGGKVKVLPGQTLKVKCPVQHFSRRLVYWSKDRRLLPYSGRIRSTYAGLKISKANPSSDAGVYTCIAGDKTATIDVGFTRKDDPSTRMYKDWIRKAKRLARGSRHQNSTTSSTMEERRGKDSIVVTSSKFNRRRKGGRRSRRQQQDESRRLAESLTFVTGDWSACSVTCGSGGHRNRKVVCSHVARKYIKIMSDEECTEQGLVKPDSAQACSQHTDCPVWRPGPWTKCYPSCGGVVGHKTRILQCEWGTSGKPAGNACDMNDKPLAKKPCKTKPCSDVCIDSSRYCSLSRVMKLCRFRAFKQQCCKTCRHLENSTS